MYYISKIKSNLSLHLNPSFILVLVLPHDDQIVEFHAKTQTLPDE